MGFSPSEKTKLLRDINTMKLSIDEIDRRQDAAIDDMKKAIADISDEVAAIQTQVDKLKMGTGNWNAKYPDTGKASEQKSKKSK